MNARLYRDYIGTDGKKRRDEVDRDPKVITICSAQQGLTVGQLLDFGGHYYRLSAWEPGLELTLEEACPAPGCVAPVTHRSLHDIPAGKPKEAAK